MDIPAEKIEEIISAHSETVTALKEERDSYKDQAEKLPGVEKQLEAATEKIKAFTDGDWEKKYTDLKSEYESFKTDTATKAERSAKEAAYKKLLADAGISAKRIDSVMKVSDLGSLKLDKEGKLEDAEKISEKIKEEWADFIAVKSEVGAETSKPPVSEGTGAGKPSLAKQMVEQYQREHYGAKEE